MRRGADANAELWRRGWDIPPEDHKLLKLLIKLADLASMEVKTAVKNGPPRRLPFAA